MPTKLKLNEQKSDKTSKDRYHFFLNPYSDTAFTRCPKCSSKTRIRKYCLVIHVEPKHVFVLNKSCRYCLECDLIIVKQMELESLLCAICEKLAPDIIGNEYFVLGTMDKNDWKLGQKNELSSHEAIEKAHLFKEVWNFEVIPGGWSKNF